MSAQDNATPPGSEQNQEGLSQEFPDANDALNAVDLDEVTEEVPGEPGEETAAGEDGDSEGKLDDGDSASDSQVEDLTNDLQRVTAEYANYRKRVDRDRVLIGEIAVAGVLNELLPVLDDLDRAKEHGDYDGVVKSIGDRLESTVTKIGLEKYGEPGEAFDPAVHEGLMTVAAEEGQEPNSCVQILRPGYKLNDKVIRTAGVAVTAE